MNISTYINPSDTQGQKFFKALKDNGEFVMLNLLKFKAIAEYDDTLNVTEITSNLSGKEAYGYYLDSVKLELEKIGNSIIFQGNCSAFLIGPENEYWDTAILVKYKSVSSFIEFSKSSAYLENIIHRTAALLDSRLLPIIPQKN